MLIFVSAPDNYVIYEHLNAIYPVHICEIVLWNTSGLEHIPNGSRLKQYRPNGVLNVHNLALGLSSSICQNPFEASSLVNHLAPAISAVIAVSVGR